MFSRLSSSHRIVQEVEWRRGRPRRGRGPAGTTVNNSLLLILRKAKDWVPNSTVNIQRQKSQSHRVLSAKERPRGPSPHNLKRGSEEAEKSRLVLRVLSLPGLPDAAGHSSDEGRSLPTAVLGFQEGHIAFRSQVSHRLVHDFGKAGKRKEGL